MRKESETDHCPFCVQHGPAFPDGRVGPTEFSRQERTLTGAALCAIGRELVSFKGHYFESSVWASESEQRYVTLARTRKGTHSHAQGSCTSL